jgi:hypothetical protein
MSAAERARLARILGMLGSEHPGESASAALQAEAFRKRHGLTWEELIQGKTVYLGGAPPWQKPEPEPAPPPPPPPARPTQTPPYEPSTWTPSPPLGPWEPRPPDIIGRWTAGVFFGVCAFAILCAFLAPELHS